MLWSTQRKNQRTAGTSSAITPAAPPLSAAVAAGSATDDVACPSSEELVVPGLYPEAPPHGDDLTPVAKGSATDGGACLCGAVPGLRRGSATDSGACLCEEELAVPGLRKGSEGATFSARIRGLTHGGRSVLPVGDRRRADVARRCPHASGAEVGGAAAEDSTSHVPWGTRSVAV